MEHANVDTVGSRQIPGIVWAALALAVAGAVAVLVFGVAIDKALTYGFFGFMILAHFSMHAGHGAHSHGQVAPGERSNEGPDGPPARGGCH